jgi:sugar phosphate isomerase/epimerase
MIIGFGSGDFYKIYSNSNEGFSKDYINHYKTNGLANAIELNCRNEGEMDYLLINNLDLSGFSFISMHTPQYAYDNDENSKRMLAKMELLTKKYNIKNIVVHSDLVLNWEIFAKYENIPISIENMDHRKKSGKTIEDIKAVLDKYNFKLTVDLQHCFVNDNSLQLAADFQEKFKDKIVEYHISGTDDDSMHYPLFKTEQDEIIKALKDKNIPIIIESTFDEIGDHEKELEYIKSRIK